MTVDPKAAKEDLAFIRAIVEDHSADYRNIGVVYLAAGLLYGLQCIATYGLLSGLIASSALLWLVVSWLPTVLFLVINFTFVWKDRATPFGAGASTRAVGAAFAGGGLAILILALIFGFVAYQRGDTSIWLLFPIVVCAMQGAVWFTTTIVRRRLWTGLTAIGWFMASVLLGLLLDKTDLYILALGAVFFLCMALPGYTMSRSTQTNRH